VVNKILFPAFSRKDVGRIESKILAVIDRTQRLEVLKIME
jgi:hypothetical protein